MQESARSHSRFTVAVVPDTQNYVSYRNQRAAGFPFNARELLWDMMHFIARNAVGNGGEIAFATAGSLDAGGPSCPRSRSSPSRSVPSSTRGICRRSRSK